MCERGRLCSNRTRKKKEEAGSETGRPPENEPNISLEETEREKGRKRGAEERTDPKIMGTRFSERMWPQSKRTDHAPAWRM